MDEMRVTIIYKQLANKKLQFGHHYGARLAYGFKIGKKVYTDGLVNITSLP